MSNREIKAILSKGTFDGEVGKERYESQFVLCVSMRDDCEIGVCYFDIST